MEDNLQSLKDSIKMHQPSAVGETGLDFFRNLSSYENQINAFEQQIKISIENNLPLFLHQREAHDDFIKVIDKYISDIPKVLFIVLLVLNLNLMIILREIYILD